jgi:hypothetical protein
MGYLGHCDTNLVALSKVAKASKANVSVAAVLAKNLFGCFIHSFN